MFQISSKRAGFVASAYSLPVALSLFLYGLDGGWVNLYPIPVIFICALVILQLSELDFKKVLLRSIFVIPFLTFSLWSVVVWLDPLEDEVTIILLLIACFFMFIQNLLMYPFFRIWVIYLHSKFYE